MTLARCGGFSGVVALSGAALLGVPIVVDLAVSDRTRPFDFLAPDAFYYFTVARNVSRLGLISFDQEHTSNGFHPLWQAVLAGCHWLIDRSSIGEGQLLALALVLGAALAAFGVYFLGRAAALERGKLGVLFAAVPFGLLSPVFLAWSGGRLWTSSWSAVNGMETGAVLGFFGLSAWLFVQPARTPRRAWQLGFALVGLTLARLDHGLFALLVVLFLWFEALRRRPFALRSAAIVSAVWLSCGGGYLLANRLYAGMWLPVSGSIKSTFPSVTLQNLQLLRDLFVTRTAIKPTLAARQLILALPVLVALVYPLYAFRVHKAPSGPGFGVSWRSGLGRYAIFLGLTALGVLGLATYDGLYVRTNNIGRWYFPVSTLFASLLLIEWVGRIPSPGRLQWLASPVARAAGLALMNVAVTCLYLHFREPGSGGRYARFYYDEAPLVAAAYSGHVPPMVEYDDGIIAFSTGAPCISGWGLVIDKDAVAAATGVGRQRNSQRRGGLIDLAIERGVVRAATLIYAEEPLSRESSDATIRQAYRRLLGKYAPSYRFRVEYLSDDGHFSIVKGELHEQ